MKLMEHDGNIPDVVKKAAYSCAGVIEKAGIGGTIRCKIYECSTDQEFDNIVKSKKYPSNTVRSLSGTDESERVYRVAVGFESDDYSKILIGQTLGGEMRNPVVYFIELGTVFNYEKSRIDLDK